MNYANNDYPKERLVSNFLSCNSGLSSWTWTEDKPSQYAGVDLSCMTKNGPVYLDLKLKNSGYSTKPTEPSKRWSVEIYRNKNGSLVPGWFTKDGQLTNVYGFEEAHGESFDDIESVDIWLFEKKALRDVIEKDTCMLIQEIRDKAMQMLEDDKKYAKLSDSFCLSRTGRDYDNMTINLCFDREVIERISRKITIMKLH